MIYFPKNYCRITASFRQLYQNLILKKGIKSNYLNSLKKINLIEAYSLDAFPQPLNVEAYFYELFTAIFLKKKFDYFINIKGNYLIDKKILTLLLLEISGKTDYLELKSFKESLVIKGNFIPTKATMLLTKKLKGIIFKELKENICCIKLNFPKTKKESEDFETAFFLLQNPLSVVNLYFQ